MKKIWFSLFLLLFSSSIFAQSFNKIIFFGDSLSDNGNVYQLKLKQFPKYPPYYEGRFSNGFVWSDRFAEYFSRKYGMAAKNYAFGGATVLGGTLKFPPTLKEEVNQFLLSATKDDKSNILFVILIGANDYVDVDVDSTTTKVVDEISSEVQKLINSGAKSFILFNLPDLAKVPYAKQVPYGWKLHDCAVKHNEKLNVAIAKLKQAYPNVSFTTVDLFALFDDMTQHTELYNQKYHKHLSNLTDMCWTGGYQLTQTHIASPSLSAVTATTNAYEAGATPCAKPDEYFFWDHVHPTAVVHEIIAQEVLEQIDPNFSK